MMHRDPPLHRYRGLAEGGYLTQDIGPWAAAVIRPRSATGTKQQADDEGLTDGGDHKKIAWLLAIPISDAEYELSQSYGSEALEDILQKNEADVFDINSKSII